MIKLLVVTHKQLYFSRTDERHSTFGGFSTWHNYLAKYVKELHILSPVKPVDTPPKGATYLESGIKVHHGLRNDTDVVKAIIYTLKIARTHNIDVVVCKIPGSIGMAGVLGSWFSRKASVFHVVGETKVLIQTLMILLVKLLLILPCSVSNAIVTESFKIRDNFMKLGIRAPKISVIPESTIDKTFFQSSRKTRTNVSKAILYLGRLSPSKGVLILVKALELLKNMCEQSEEFKLVILGDGELRGELQREMKKHGLAGIVEFKGFVPHGEVKKHLNRCNMLVLPSISEGRGKVILEAMAAARPVVATRVGGIPEIVKDGVNGLLVRPNDPSALAKALYRLLKDESLAFKLGKKGRCRAQIYKLDKIIPSYVSFITKVLANTKSTCM